MEQHNIISLDKLSVGQSAFIHSFSDKNLSLKLIEMGCVPGETITIKNKAPLGGTIAISVLDYMLGLRKEEASHILVVILNNN